jgi:hypothetical protein
VEKVVATIEVPISHHGAERPEAKNSSVPLLALRAKKTAVGVRKNMRAKTRGGI